MVLNLADSPQTQGLFVLSMMACTRVTAQGTATVPASSRGMVVHIKSFQSSSGSEARAGLIEFVRRDARFDACGEPAHPNRPVMLQLGRLIAGWINSVCSRTRVRCLIKRGACYDKHGDHTMLLGVEMAQGRSVACGSPSLRAGSQVGKES